MKQGNIDLEEISTVLATKIIHAGHITTFTPDATADPITDVVYPEVHKKVQKFLETELCELLKAA